MEKILSHNKPKKRKGRGEHEWTRGIMVTENGVQFEPTCRIMVKHLRDHVLSTTLHCRSKGVINDNNNTILLAHL